MMKEKHYGDGLKWSRGKLLGKGSFGSVYMATLKNGCSKYSCFPPIMAVKSAEVSLSGSIQKEKEVLMNLMGSSNIIACLGEEETTSDNGMMVYNLLMEYGCGGTLGEKIQRSGLKGLPEFEVKCYTKSILKGLKFVHEMGYVHCDLKPDNVLLVSNYGNGSSEFMAKIGDFGLAKREKSPQKRKLGPCCEGTLLYMSPEAVCDCVQEKASDIWALGCIVLEMLTGKPAWGLIEDLSTDEFLKKIGKARVLPKIPRELSKEAKDFLKKCLVRNPKSRSSAEKLLDHAFVQGVEEGSEDVEEEDWDAEEEVGYAEDCYDGDSSEVYVEEFEDDEFRCNLYEEQHSNTKRKRIFGNSLNVGTKGYYHAIQGSMLVPAF